MKRCKQIEPFMADALSGVITENNRKILEEHLRNCPTCDREYHELQVTLKAMSNRSKSEPDAAFMESFWMRLSPRLNASSKKQRLIAASKLLLRPRLAIPVTAVICLFIGLWIGRGIRTPDSRQTVNSGLLQNTEVQTRALRILGRSQYILLALENFDPATDETDILNLAQQKTIAEDLVQETREVKPLLSEQPDKRLELLVSELEAILLQIANMETDDNPEVVDLIRIGVENILFKIQLTGITNNTELGSPGHSRKI